MNADTVRIGFADNPDLKAYFARQETGAECKLEITFILKRADDMEATGVLTEVGFDEGEEYEGDEGEEMGMGEENTAPVTGKEPAFVIIGMAKKKQKEQPIPAWPGEEA